MSAKWDSVTAIPLDPSAGVSDRDGLTLSFQNGDPCRGSSRKLKMNMICDNDEIGTSFPFFRLTLFFVIISLLYYPRVVFL